MKSHISHWPCAWVLATGVAWWVYVLALYFQATTASLHDAYQPGIEWLRLVFSPGWILLGAFLAACLFRAEWVARSAMYWAAGAFLTCLLMWAVVVHDGVPVWFQHWAPTYGSNIWVKPEDRSLGYTVQVALFRPSFSNRSVGVIWGSAFLALVLGGASAWVWRRRSPLCQAEGS